MKRALFTPLLLAALSTLALTGCVPMDDKDGDDSYRNAIPSAQAVELQVPDSNGSGQLAVGDASVFYQMTRSVSVNVNTRVIVILGTLRWITLFPATERGDDYRIWGPSEPQGLEAFSWRLRMDKISDNRFSFELDGRAKGLTEEADFITVVTGEVTPGDGEHKSEGTFSLLFDNANTLGSERCTTGTVNVAWDALTDVRTVNVVWNNFERTCPGEEEKILNASYDYSENADKSGTFAFATEGNIHAAAENKPELELVKMNSRWEATGEGRSDVVMSGTEIAADLASVGLTETSVQASQCWSDLFVLTYANTAPPALQPFIFEELGAEADCAYTTAEYPNL